MHLHKSVQVHCCFCEQSVRLVDDKQHDAPMPALAQLVGLASFMQGEGLSNNRSSQEHAFTRQRSFPRTLPGRAATPFVPR
jgi:hypothetical protein